MVIVRVGGWGCGHRDWLSVRCQSSVRLLAAELTASLTCKRKAAILTLPVIRSSQVSTRALPAGLATAVAATAIAATLPGVLDSSRVVDFYVMIKACLETVRMFFGVLRTHRSCLSTMSCEGRTDIAQLFSQFCLFFFFFSSCLESLGRDSANTGTQAQGPARAAL